MRKDKEMPNVVIPYEIGSIPVNKGDIVQLMDIDANELGEYPVFRVLDFKDRRTQLVVVKVPVAIAKKIAGFRAQDKSVSEPLEKPIITTSMADDAMICLCERVSVKEVRDLIKQGITDLNQIKAITRAGMGPCGAKTCDTLIRNLMREEGVSAEEVVANTRRPIFVEATLDIFPDGDSK
jgi:bacterioferritin-associated ferredoxin